MKTEKVITEKTAEVQKKDVKVQTPIEALKSKLGEMTKKESTKLISDLEHNFVSQTNKDVILNLLKSLINKA